MAYTIYCYWFYFYYHLLLLLYCLYYFMKSYIDILSVGLCLLSSLILPAAISQYRKRTLEGILSYLDKNGMLDEIM